MNEALKFFKLTKRYNFIMPLDADTQVDSKFIDNILPIFEGEEGKKIACICGKVKGRNYGYLTSYRMWEYEVVQAIHKNAQSTIGAVIVCPGCATVYRSEVFEKVSYPTGTLTEDMDLTFLIHRRNLGKILFSEEGIVLTQDPGNLKSFLKQLDRWYIGFWQCLIKHNVPWGGQSLDFEVALLALEGLYNGILVSLLLVILPISLFLNPLVIAIPFSFDLFLLMIPTLALTAYRNRFWRIFSYIPQFYMMRLISSLVFLRSFVKVISALDTKMSSVWDTLRYKVRKEDIIWPSPSLQ